MKQYPIISIKNKLIKIFDKLNLDENEANIIIDNIISSEIIKKRTHGLILLPHIVIPLLTPPKEKVCWTWKNSHLICEANNHLGYLTLGKAVEKTTTKVIKTKTIAFSTIAKITHAGRLGHYCHGIAKKNLIGIVFAHSNPWVAAPSGKKAVLGSVAFSASIPFTNPPLIIDFTPNLVTAGEIRLQSLKGKEFDISIGIDSDGNLTKNPDKILNGGAIQAIGAHKGFVISLLISIISTMIGGDAIAKIEKGYGYFLIVINPDFLGVNNYIERCQELIDEIKKSGDNIHIPGENYTEIEKNTTHIEINKKIIDMINGLDSLKNKDEYKYFLENYDKAIILKN